jgi:hypothetical protein
MNFVILVFYMEDQRLLFVTSHPIPTMTIIRIIIPPTSGASNFIRNIAIATMIINTIIATITATTPDRIPTVKVLALSFFNACNLC